MAQSNVSKAIASISRVAFKNGLQAAGFRRQGNHLVRYSNDLIHGIHFQASRSGTVSSGRFTINLVVTSEALYRHWTGLPLPTNPVTTMYPVSERIGLLMHGKDQWWEVHEETNIDLLAAEATNALLTYGLPFFGAFPAASAFLDLLRDGKIAPGMTKQQSRLVHAMLAKDAGYQDEARRELQAAFDETRIEGFKSTILSLAERLGFTDIGAASAE